VAEREGDGLIRAEVEIINWWLFAVGRHEGWNLFGRLYVDMRIILKLALKKYCWLPLTGLK
jgi:hypothetical protein